MNVGGRLIDKKVLVTGSGTGIGREIALEFARQGADVALHCSHSTAGAESAAAEIRSMGRQAAVFSADFDCVDEVLQLADKAIALLGKLDCLINNAGITFNRPFRKVTLEQFDRLYHVNVRAQFFLTQRVAEEMLKHGGRRRVQSHFNPRPPGRTRAFGLCRVERRNHRLHARPGRGIGPSGSPRECDCTRLHPGRKLLQGVADLQPGGWRPMGARCDSRRPRGHALRNRQARGIPLLG